MVNMARYKGVAPDYMKFDGERFGLNLAYRHKGTARIAAKKHRNQGYKVRVISRKGLDGHIWHFEYMRKR